MAELTSFHADYYVWTAKAKPQIAAAYDTGNMPPLLPAPGDRP